MAKILLADDDCTATEAISRWLQNVSGHVVEVVSNGEDALYRLKFYEFDLAILDCNMPGLSGVEVCKSARANQLHLPILMLTAKSSIADKETGFLGGADDYLTKPFDLKELSLRVSALLKRPRKLESVVYDVGGIQLDVATKQVYEDSKPVNLTPKEYCLLEVLLKNTDRWLSAEQIANKLWSSESEVSPLAVKTLVSRLKAKLMNKQIIQNIHGLGYCIRQSRPMQSSMHGDL